LPFCDSLAALRHTVRVPTLCHVEAALRGREWPGRSLIGVYDFWSDEPPSVIVRPSFGVVDPPRRTHLAECLYEPGIVLGRSLVRVAEDSLYGGPGELDSVILSSPPIAISRPQKRY